MRRPTVYAAPITYELDGVQYIAASVGGTAQGDYFAPTLCAHAGVQGGRHREAAAECAVHAARS